MRSPSMNNPVTKIIIHHTEVSRTANPDQWEQTNSYHKLRFNFLSSMGFYVGYTYEIAADGTVRQARAEGEETAAVLGQNTSSISICLDGNFDIEMPTLAQVLALQKLLLEVSTRFHITPHKIFPHRFYCGTPPYKSCCGSMLPDNWGTLVAISNPNDLPSLIASPLGGFPEARFEAE